MKNKCGFTLLEVVLSLFILVGAVSIFSSLQFKSVMRVLKGREDIDRIFLIKKDLYELFLNYPKKDKPVVDKLENPEVKITTELLDINKRSKLADFKEQIKIIKSDGEWKSGPSQNHLKMVGFILIPEEVKEKQKKG